MSISKLRKTLGIHAINSVIDKVIVYREDATETVWKVDNSFDIEVSV